jgi:ribosomal protein L40E
MNVPVTSKPEPEQQLCVSCVAPNDPAAHFCGKCGAPLTSYAATAPFEHLFAEGHVYRQAAERPQRLIVVLGMWLIFGGMALAGIGLMILGLESGAKYYIPGGLFMVLIAAALIWKTTRNYLHREKPVVPPGA